MGKIGAMKIWPIITLGGLLYGSLYADGMNTGRESNPHPRHHGLTELEADLAADMKAFDQPHRPVTMGYREFFAKILADETEWTAPEDKQQTVGDNTDNPDDGEDPGKKLFWHSVFPDNPAVPFPGWGDPNPVPNPDTVAPPFQGSRDVGFEIIFINEAATEPDQTPIAMASSHITTSAEGFSPAALKAINDLGDVPLPPQCKPGSADLSCLIAVACAAGQAIMKGVCDDGDKPTLPVDPGNPLNPPVGSGTGDPPPFVGGGGSGSGVGGGIGTGGGVSAGTIPEPSTWAMIITGFALMGALGWRRRASRRSSSASSSSS